MNPYKLLLYEEGSFFRPHKDSEKEPGMVATLVICLSSKHTGGDVNVAFRGKNEVLSTAPASEFDLTALAWYSDVTHEVKPVTSGYRLALTYNVVAKGDGTPPARRLTTQLDGLHSALTQWPASLPSLFYTLDHKYSQASISMKNLKGRDLAVGENLLGIARECDMLLFLVNMSRTEDEDEDDYYYGADDSYGTSRGSGDMSVYTCDSNEVSSYMSYRRSDGDVLDPEAFLCR